MLLIDPLKVIGYLRYPPIALSVYYAAVTFGSLYVLNISVTYTFKQQPYNFSTLIVGLLYIPNSIGYIISSIVGGRWMDHIMKREARKAGRRGSNGRILYIPEDRMRENAWLGAFLYPVALIWYGWTTQKGVFWIAPVSWFSLTLICKVQYPVLTRGAADDSQLLLRHWFNADIRNGHHDVDRIYAKEVLVWCGVEQFGPQHSVLHGRYCWRAAHRCHWKWLAVHYTRFMGTV